VTEIVETSKKNVGEKVPNYMKATIASCKGSTEKGIKMGLNSKVETPSKAASSGSLANTRALQTEPTLWSNKVGDKEDQTKPHNLEGIEQHAGETASMPASVEDEHGT
jgi:hypothetical protein